MECIEHSWKTQDGLTIFAQEYRPDRQPKAVVCLVHGLGEHCCRYQHVASAYTHAGYAMLMFDLRGHGRSDGARGHSPSLDAIFDDIGLLLSKAEEIYSNKPIFLYGHSLGGSLVLNYVLRRCPELSGVVVTSPGLQPAVDPPGWKTTLGKLMYQLWPSLTLSNGLDRTGLSRDPRIIQAYIQDPLVHDRVTARLGLDIINSGLWALEHAREFRLPLLLLHGSADRVTSCEASQRFCECANGDITFIRWEGGYHELHNEPDQKEVIGVIVDWIGKHLIRDEARG